MADIGFSASTKHDSVVRCPACGQPLEKPIPPACPLCQAKFSTSTPLTNVDASPYAVAYQHGRNGLWRMAEWVWFASEGRLKHLALMRASIASSAFAWRQILLSALLLGAVQASSVGLRWVTATPSLEPSGSVNPAKPFWVHVAAAPRPLPLDSPPEVSVDLWWNPVQSIIAFGYGYAAAVVFLWILLSLIRIGVAIAHGKRYQLDKRMSAATYYATAWTIPLLVACGLAALQPLGHVGTMAHSSWVPPAEAFGLAAAVVGGIGLVLSWFWWVRMAYTAPVAVRGKVVAFGAIVSPVIGVGFGAGWWFGLAYVCTLTFSAMGLTF